MPISWDIFLWLIFLSVIALLNIVLSMGSNGIIKWNKMSSKFIKPGNEEIQIGNRFRTFLFHYQDFKVDPDHLKSDREIGEILGVSKQTVGRYFKGKSITYQLLYHMHLKYHLNINWLFTGNGDFLCSP